MKKIISLILATILFAQNLFAMVVTDPTSYTYYAQQLKTFNDSVKTSLEQLESINKLNELSNTANELLDDVSGLLYNPQNQIQGIYDNLVNSIERFEDIGERVSNMNATTFLKNYHNVKDNAPTGEDFKKWEENFEALFDNSKDDVYLNLKKRVDEALENKKYEDWGVARQDLDKYLYLKKLEREQLKKYSLLAPTEYYNDYYLNEETVAKREKTKQHIEKLTKQIDSSTDLMQQTQTTNQILIEMLSLLQGQYELSMMYYNSVSVVNLSTEVQNKEIDMKDIEKSRKKFDEEKNKDKTNTTEKAVIQFMEEKTKNAKGSLILEMLGQGR